MENINQEEGLNRFGKKLEKLLESRGIEIADLSDSYPVAEDDVRLNLFIRDHPDQDFVAIIFDCFKVKSDHRESLLSTTTPRHLKRA